MAVLYMKELAIKKLYYSISEVSKLTSIKAYVLRYWETEFSELNPSKNRAGKRIYRSKDVEIVLLIKKLLYTEKFTIEGARQKLKDQFSKERSENKTEDSKEQILGDIKADLKELLGIIDS